MSTPFYTVGYIHAGTEHHHAQAHSTVIRAMERAAYLHWCAFSPESQVVPEDLEWAMYPVVGPSGTVHWTGTGLDSSIEWVIHRYDV